jgi:predicted phosphate transport protein (TIGR00153 family)
MINLFPKDEIFYSLFEAQAEKLKEAAQILTKILKEPQNLEQWAISMKNLEKEADALGHNVVARLRETFITPLDGEDINLLRQKLDDIMDLIEKAVNRLAVYKIKAPFPQEIEKFVEILEKMIEEISLGVSEMRNINKFGSKLQLRCQSINELENIADDVYRGGLKRLSENCDDRAEKILAFVKLREIYEAFENATDACEDVGNIFETILIKNR